MRAGVDDGLPVTDLVDQVHEAVTARRLYVLPNFTDEGLCAEAQAIASGPITR